MATSGDAVVRWAIVSTWGPRTEKIAALGTAVAVLLAVVLDVRVVGPDGETNLTVVVEVGW